MNSNTGASKTSQSIFPDNYEFRIPRRVITSVKAMEIWLRSKAYLEYVAFIADINREVRGKAFGVDCYLSEITKGILAMLEKLDTWITEIPPIQQPIRLNNKAFKTWYNKVKENVLALLQENLPSLFHHALPEISVYLMESFGNSTRIDYGIGHEMNFCIFLLCLFKIGAFGETDSLAVINKIFNRYMILVRRLLTVYDMEPAFGRSVWTLDDYNFLAFIWGSSQLIGHPRIETRSYLQPDLVKYFSKDYMFLGCIEYINKVKPGPFERHSNQLWNLSAIGTWRKINESLINMYKTEVLSKFNVVQHSLFGSLFPMVIAPIPKMDLIDVLGTIDSSKCISAETHEFRVPQRGVTSAECMEVWLKSEAYLEYMGFITAMNGEVRGRALSVDCHMSEVTQGILAMLEKLDTWITETPPIQQPQRFGNKAFKIWYDKVKENASELLQEALPSLFHRAVIEIKEYLTESFGNSTRIDYGTGHEMSFCMFLCCLFKIGAFVVADNLAVVNKIFNRYMILARRLQTVYKMEPAGSRGVWALDDFQFIPFIWGSSQLIDHPRLEPRSILQENIVDSFANDYMFLGCIQYINLVKKGPFAEHSNQLWNISGVSYWGKVNDGLIKMYKAEVLAKFPVIQHVLFGSLLPLVVAPIPPPKPNPNVRMTRLPKPPDGFAKPNTGQSPQSSKDKEADSLSKTS